MKARAFIWCSLLLVIAGCLAPEPVVSQPLPATTSAPTDLCPGLGSPPTDAVYVSNEAELRDRAYNASPGTTIVVQPGTYELGGVIHVVNDGITIRGASGRREEVILDGGGMLAGLTHVVLIEADDVTVADLTIRDAGEHGVSVNGTDRPRLYNLHIVDVGSQLVKVNPAGDGSDDGVLACSLLEYTTAAPDEYTNGISAHDAHGWTVRDNRWERIRTPGGTPVPTILFWSGSSGTVVERNVLVDCFQGIAFGNAGQTGVNHTGGVVRNNFIYASLPHDVLVEMVRATGWVVAHNTVVGVNPAGGVTWGMEARFAESEGTFAYNLTNLALWPDRDGASATTTGNVTTAGASWFEDPARGDLHLLSSAVDAIDVAAPLAEVPADIDGQGRPLGPAPDAGADEYAPAPALTPRLYLPVILRGYDRAVPVPTPTTQPPVGGGLISPADLVYRGAFRLPPHPTGEGWEWSSWASAATYVPTGDPEGPADGYPGSLYAVGNDLTREVGEVAIPVPVISAGKELSELNVATQLQDFGSITGALFPEMELPRVGLAYLPPQGEQSSAKLYFAMAPHMGEGDAGPSHGWSELDLSRPQTAGLWRVGDYWNYVTGDYLFEIPSNWATAYLSGRSLATGRFRDGGQGAMGPSLFAVAPWAAGTPPPAGARLPATPLLLYEDVTRPAPAALNGYHHSDEWTGAAWLTAGEDAAVLFAGTKGQGDSWYGCPDGTDAPPWPPDCWDRGWWSTSFVGQFLFYDPADFAAVTRGELGPEQPQPYATLNVDEVLYHIVEPRQKTHVGALAFHRTRGLLYLFEPLVDEDRPLVHVWKVE